MWPPEELDSHSHLPIFSTELEHCAADWCRFAEAKRPAAVLVLFLISENPEEPTHIVLTRRTTTVRTHKGQVGFPGGRLDPGDSSPTTTALRETHEEVGLPPHLVTAVGQLAPHQSIDGNPVIPVVAYSKALPGEFIANPAEVATIIFSPWTDFLKSCDRPFRYRYQGTWRNSHMFESQGHKVWGLTAKILAELNMQK